MLTPSESQLLAAAATEVEAIRAELPSQAGFFFLRQRLARLRDRLLEAAGDPSHSRIDPPPSMPA